MAKPVHNPAFTALPQRHGALIAHQVVHIPGTKPAEFEVHFEYADCYRILRDSVWYAMSHDQYGGVGQWQPETDPQF